MSRSNEITPKKNHVSFKRRRLWILVLFCSFTFLVWNLERFGYLSSEIALNIQNKYPILSIIIFIAFYIVSVVALIPTLPLNILAGVVWGGLLGGAVATMGSTGGAILAFLLVRTISDCPWTSYFNIKGGKWSQIEAKIDENAALSIAIVRLNPLFPSGPANFLFGLTGISFSTYSFWSTVFFFPPSLAVAILADEARYALMIKAPQEFGFLVASFTAVSILLAGYFVAKELRKQPKKERGNS
jgi:uncharacterized membrane protein YdjX (TVP38/TMEM64 family)